MIKEVNGFKKGDLVYINRDWCYYSYTQFIKLHPKYMLRWTYRSLPDEETVYIIDGIYKHVLKNTYDNSKCVVVVQHQTNKQTFLMSELGLIHCESNCVKL